MQSSQYDAWAANGAAVLYQAKQDIWFNRASFNMFQWIWWGKILPREIETDQLKHLPRTIRTIECGTVCCIAGAIVIRHRGSHLITHSGTPWYAPPDRSGVDDAAADILGVDLYDARQLFFADQWPKLHSSLDNQPATMENAFRAIDFFTAKHFTPDPYPGAWIDQWGQK